MTKNSIKSKGGLEMDLVIAGLFGTVCFMLGYWNAYSDYKGKPPKALSGSSYRVVIALEETTADSDESPKIYRLPKPADKQVLIPGKIYYLDGEVLKIVNE